MTAVKKTLSTGVTEGFATPLASCDSHVEFCFVASIGAVRSHQAIIGAVV